MSWGLALPGMRKLTPLLLAAGCSSDVQNVQLQPPELDVPITRCAAWCTLDMCAEPDCMDCGVCKGKKERRFLRGRKPPADIVRRKIAPSEPARVQINCPQHAACTWFAEAVCSTFDDALCDHDHVPCWKAVPEPKDNRDYVVKTTILPHDNELAWKPLEHASNRYRILFLRSPLDQFADIAKEHWRQNCGGYVEKFVAYDALVQRAYIHPGMYDAILFAENAYADLNASLVGPGLRPANSRTPPPDPDYFDVREGEREICALMPFICALYHLGYNPNSPRDKAGTTRSWFSAHVLESVNSRMQRLASTANVQGALKQSQGSSMNATLAQ